MPNINTKQQDQSDCGPACLLAIAKHYRRSFSLAQVRTWSMTDLNGSTLWGLQLAADQMGFLAKGVRSQPEQLNQAPFPCIAHCIREQTLPHYVVIRCIQKGYIQIMDPALWKTIKVSLASFKNEWTGHLLLLVPGEHFKVLPDAAKPWQGAWALIKPHRSALWQALVGGMAYTLLGLSMSIYLQKIMDYVLADGNRNLLNLMACLMLLLSFMQCFLGQQRQILIMKTAQKMDASLILGYFHRLFLLPQDFFDRMRIGELSSRLGDAIKIRTFMNEVAMDIVLNALILTASFALMFAYHWQLALLCLALLPCYLFIYAFINAWNRRWDHLLVQKSANIESFWIEIFQSMKTIKSFHAQARWKEKNEALSVDFMLQGLKASQGNVWGQWTGAWISQSFTVMVLWLGASMVLEGSLTAGELMSFYALLAYFSNPIQQLILSNKSYRMAIIAAERLFETMKLEEEPNQIIPIQGQKPEGDLRFQSVGFSFGARAPLFEELNLCFPKGKHSALIGENGSGKSSLFALMMGLYPLQQGHIWWGEEIIAHLPAAILRREMAWVPQQIALFAGNAMENIAMENLPKEASVIQICQSLGLSDALEALPQSYWTPLGERGFPLSGGQRQLLGLARALYRKPRVLLLDEASSALDEASKSKVSKVLQAYLKEGNTMVSISHEWRALPQLDHIVCLQAGKVIGEGKHEELIHTCEWYAQNFRQKSGL